MPSIAMGNGGSLEGRIFFTKPEVVSVKSWDELVTVKETQVLLLFL